MATLHLETLVAAPPERCFDLARDVDVHMAGSAAFHERAIAGVMHGKMRMGDEVTWEAKHLGRRWRLTSRITAFEPPHRFVDDMQRGPFARWHHEHRFQPTPAGTLMIDDAEFASPYGWLGRLVDRVLLTWYMRRLLLAHDRFIRDVAESAASAGKA